MEGDMSGLQRTISCVTAALAVPAWLAAVGPAAAQNTPVKVALLTQPGIWDAGLYAAVDRKFFEAEKLAVSFVSPPTPADGVKLVASGGANFATAHSTEVITARSRGLPVISIATTHQFGTAGIMIPAAAGVTSLKQLEGKTIGVTGIPFNKTMLEYSLKKSGVDLSKVKIVTVGFTPMPLLLSKRIDALGDAITWSEPAMYNIQLKKAANDKTTYKYFAFYENGVPRYYTFGVVADERELAKNPDLARRYLRAWAKGQDWAIKNQAAAVEGMRKHSPELNAAEAAANLAEIARISQSPDTQKNGLGWQDVKVWEAQEAFMREQKLIPAKVDVTKAVTNAYLTK
jgi:ABC-type nitrate/sulfonate/bicarbonate transport system substrate-binding protein